MEETTEMQVEEREELMVSSNSQILRKAHFLKPTHPSSKPQLPKNPTILSPSFPPKSQNRSKTLVVTLKGWRNQSAEWQQWVQHLEGLYHSVWKRAGIYEAVMSSAFKFQRDSDVIIGLAKKWCLDTNTFVFPWGEATITLQDMMVLGGFSVYGSPVFSGSVGSPEDEEIKEKLKKANKELYKKPVGSNRTWIMSFMKSGSSMEHEAFLSLWLQRFVFNDSSAELDPRVLSIAIHLAKGEVVALSSAVLASIYRDLGLLNTAIVARNENAGDKLTITLSSSLHLVQLWAWERFPTLQPWPNPITNGDPRSARWKNAIRKYKNVRSCMDSAGESFCWQPYSDGLHNLCFHKFHEKEERWQDIGSDQDLVAYGICLRVCELVGLNCIQPYNPHRVAMQFGLDQDIPSDIEPSVVTPEVAWSNYIRPFGNTKVFVPNHFSKPGVSVRYLDWWNKTAVDSIEDRFCNVARRKRSSRTKTRSKWVPLTGIGKSLERNTHEEDDAIVTPLNELEEKNYAEYTEKRSGNRNGGETMDDNCKIPGLALEAQIPSNGLREKTDVEVRNYSSSIQNMSGMEHGEESDDYSGEIPGLALEARIAALERAFAKLKAASN